MDDIEQAATVIGSGSSLLLVLSLWLRRRMRSKRPLFGSFRPRGRIRADISISLRTHKRSEVSPSLEPGPFSADDVDTGKHHRLPDADE